MTRGGERRSRWTPSDVKQWRKENGYTWHERNDMVICDLVPTKINRFILMLRSRIPLIFADKLGTISNING